MNIIKKLSTLIIILVLSLSFVGCDEVEITFPNEVDLESIVLSESSEKNNIPITITDNEEIKNTLNSIKSDSKKTNKESVSESPVNIEHYINLELLYSTNKNQVDEVYYIYKLKNRYYIEQSYIGIWSITQESYDNISKLVSQL